MRLFAATSPPDVKTQGAVHYNAGGSCRRRSQSVFETRLRVLRARRCGRFGKQQQDTSEKLQGKEIPKNGKPVAFFCDSSLGVVVVAGWQSAACVCDACCFGRGILSQRKGVLKCGIYLKLFFASPTFRNC
jgi:hypothetical protein